MKKNKNPLAPVRKSKRRPKRIRRKPVSKVSGDGKPEQARKSVPESGKNPNPEIVIREPELGKNPVHGNMYYDRSRQEHERSLKRKFDFLGVAKPLRMANYVAPYEDDEQKHAQKSNRRQKPKTGKKSFYDFCKHNTDDNRTLEEVSKNERSLKKVDDDKQEEAQKSKRESGKKSKKQARSNGIMIREPDQSGKNPFLEFSRHNVVDNRSREDILRHERSLKKPVELVSDDDSDDSDDEVYPFVNEVPNYKMLRNGAVIREPGPSKNPFIRFPTL